MPPQQTEARAAKPVARQLPKPPLSPETLKTLYVRMVQSRALSELLPGTPGIRHNRREAVEAGCLAHLKSQDAVVTAHSAPAAALCKGASLRQLTAEFGSHFRDLHLLARDAALTESKASFSARNDQGLGLAAGLALAAKERKVGATLMFFPNGEIESLTRWRALITLAIGERWPLISVCEIADARSTLRRDAQSYNLPCITVDGADVVAVFRVAQETIIRARRGDGPTLIECSASMPGENLRRDPVLRAEESLVQYGIWSAQWKQKVVEQFKRDFEIALRSGSARSAGPLQPTRVLGI